MGVYCCDCGSNIAGTIDVEDLREYAESIPNVSVAREYKYMCSDPGQALIREDIEKGLVDRVVVAACSPRLHERTFRKCTEAGGENPFLSTMANVREHASWVHTNEPEKATEKAKDLVRMAVSKTQYLEPLEMKEVPIAPSALIIGGGIAGISAALDLSEEGFEVHLVERTPSIGGNMAKLDKTFPTMDCSACILTPKMSEVGFSENIKLYTYAEVSEIDGYVGNFTAKIKMKPRYVDMEKCNGCGDCVEPCPVSVPSEFDVGMSPRKAIYIPFAQAIPNRYTIDMDACIKCGKCEKACQPEAINFDDEEKIIEIGPIGTIILATGYQTYDPKTDFVWKYKVSPNVITGIELERLLNASGPTSGQVLKPDGSKPKSVAFLQCIGSRDKNRNEWCSRICCMYALKQARMLREKYPDTLVTVYYMDIRAFGKGYEEFYDQAMQQFGVNLVRGRIAEITTNEEKGTLIVRAEDSLLGKILALEYDMVVLAVGVEPNCDTLEVAKTAGVSLSQDGFFLEAHPKLAPVDTATRGVFVAGCSQGPKDIPDTVAQGKAAASAAATFLVRGKAEVEPFTPEFEADLCVGCGICESMCPYSAITVEPDPDYEGELKSHVNDAKCHGCGICCVACPQGALQLKGFKDEQILAQVDAVLPTPLDVAHSGQEV